VNDVEQIRVVDATMKEKWKNLQVSQPSGNNNVCRIMIYVIICINRVVTDCMNYNNVCNTYAFLSVDSSNQKETS